MKKLFTLLVLLLPATAFAQPAQRQTDPDTLSNFLDQPAHVLEVFAAVGAVVFVWLLFRGGQGGAPD